ncbi:MAG TPA: cytochrome c oxidase subunit II transmembrane domain-containing protein, partial [Xanthobacteraceae bacterium]|nr:cytochrome c oxidase subunit II transmembrane domain-containing protein [Xanthobacteraceae bacterium]
MRPMLNRIHRMAWTAFFMLAGLLPVAAAQRGQPSPWEINFQPPATPIMEFIETFHNWLLVITGLITLFVTAL